MTSIRTLLVDDNCEFLTSCKRFLSKFPEIEVVGHANSGYEALQQLNLLKPDLVLLDIIMPKMNGLEATRRIKSLSRTTRVVILTLHNLSEYQNAATDVGADGFVFKSEITVQLLPLIDKLFNRNNN